MSRITSVLAGTWFLWVASLVGAAGPAFFLSAPAFAATIVEKRVAASTDDAEEFSTGSMYISSSDLELIHDSDDQTVGMRWTGLSIPRGASITAAYIQFTAKEGQSEVTTLTLRAQASDNAPAFSSTSLNLTSRTKTSASQSWSPAAWSAGGAGASQRTPDLSGLIQEVVDRGGWASGNALVVLVTGTGHRTAWAYDGSPTEAPLLHVEYSLGTSGDAPPNPVLSVSVLPSPALTVLADGSASTDDTDSTPIASYRFDFGDGTPAVTTQVPTATAPHTYALAGTYTVSLVVTDTGGNASSVVTKSVTVSAAVTGSVDRRVAASSDDAEESSSGSVNLTSPDLELIHDGSDQTVGMRWTNVTVPKNAVITRAYLQFRAKESQSEATTLTLRGQAADNAATFSGSQLSTRARTATRGTWTPASWTGGAAGSAQQTPDLSGVIQEIVNRSGWASGNALAIIVNGTGHRTAYSFDGGAADAPLLHVEYGGTPAPNQAPIAKLSVSVTSPPLTVTADGSASSDSDPFPIKTYRFDFGDGTSAVTTNAPSAIAPHTYAGAGTYTVTLRCTDTAGLQSSSVSRSVTVSAPSQVTVYAGYYDTHHTDHLHPKPSPWLGSSNTIFAGNPDTPGTNDWDTSAIRVDNTSGASLSGVKVTVDMGTHHFALWGTYTIPAGQRLIVAQTGIENFDGSDTNVAGCFNCAPADCGTKVLSTVPVVHVTIGSKTTDYVDPGQILNTHGVDQAGCPYTGTRNDESSAWVQIFPRVNLMPEAPSSALAPSQTVADARAGLRFSLSPNPARGSLRVSFRLSTAGVVRLDVLDVAGRVIHHGAEDLMEPGEYVRPFDLSGVAPGVYFCRLTTPDGIQQRTIVLTR